MDFLHHCAFIFSWFLYSHFVSPLSISKMVFPYAWIKIALFDFPSLNFKRYWKFVNMIFFPVRRLSNYKSLITSYTLIQEQQEKLGFVLNSHRTPHFPSPCPCIIGYKKYFASVISLVCLISLEIKCRHLYSTRCHSKTAGKNIFLLWI